MPAPASLYVFTYRDPPKAGSRKKATVIAFSSMNRTKREASFAYYNYLKNTLDLDDFSIDEILESTIVQKTQFLAGLVRTSTARYRHTRDRDWVAASAARGES